MNKIELINALAEKENISRQAAKRCVEQFFNSMTETLANNERVEIRGLCSFYTKTYKSYHGRNPKTGQIVTVEPKRLPFFKVGEELKKRVDKRQRE